MATKELLRSFLRRRRQELIYLGSSDREAEFNAIGFAHNRALRRVLSECAINCVIDVGANVGAFGHEIRSTEYTGRIFSFEPGSAAFETLQQAANADEDWRAVNCALGRECGTAMLGSATDSRLNSLRVPKDDLAQQLGADITFTATQSVPIDTLDRLWPRVVSDIPDPHVFLKIDTQGFDQEVIAGAVQSLAQCVALQTEVAVQHLYNGVQPWWESIEFLRSEGWGIVGMFPSAHSNRGDVLEFDCLMIKA